MSVTNYAGLDYGFGKTNIDVSNGIRYGVIPMHEVMQMWADESETTYTPRCPICGNDLPETPPEGIEVEGDDMYCPTCKKMVEHDDQTGEEPDSITYEEDGYSAFQDDHFDIMIVKSPYYTFAQYCSPCAPGAGYIMSPCESGPKTYCFGHDWFENEIAPYPVYSVETGERVNPA